MRLGLRRRLVVDGWGRQGAIVYRILESPRAVDDRLRSLGVTGVVWAEAPRGLQRLTDDLAFYDWVRRSTDPLAEGAGYRVSSLRDDPPPETGGESRVAVAGCGRIVVLDWQEVDQEWRGVGFGGCRESTAAESFEEAAARSRFVVMAAGLQAPRASLEAQGWLKLFEWRGVVAFSRQEDAP